MRIAFVIPGLGPGGAERVASLLANFWIERGHTVTLVSFEPGSTEPFYSLGEAVAVRSLEATGGAGGPRIAANLTRISRLRALLRELNADAVVSFTTDANVVSLLAALGLGIPVIVSERNQPDRPGLGPLHKAVRRLSYPLASAMVVQTEAIGAWVRARFRMPLHVIPNPVLLKDAVITSPDRAANGKRVISVGRLTRQKGFDLLIRSFAGVAAKHPDWSLVIHGEGPDRSKLERLRDELGLGARVSLPGLTKNIGAALAGADLFALPSRFEGYPNALLEALAAGLPVIAASGPGGTAEILAGGTHGMLVRPDDVEAMTDGLDRMLSDAKLRQTYARRARDAVANLDVAVVGERWLDLITEASRSDRPR